MPRAKHSTHPDHVRTTGSKSPTDPSKNDVPQAHDSDPYQTPKAVPFMGENPLHLLLVRTDGWLRVVPDADGKLVWWKWKFSRGKHQGCYVMVRGFVDQHEEAMVILNRKLGHVDLGYERPTRDSFFEPV